MPPISNTTKILVFLPSDSWRTIVNRLSENGYDSVGVSTVAGAFDALRSDQFGFVITTRSHIDLVRTIRAIPVINIEIFFHARISGGGVRLVSKQFESKAFLDRVAFLARPVGVVKQDPAAGRTVSLKKEEHTLSHLWTLAAAALRFSQKCK
ncbi:hypothetical protein [Pararhizobium antarcticum]|uniref:Uncharacterized protein n=1 Tax=Pararhizobium antarcticum TaxID=1798805 RepID=A0A657LK51_9HYPH|nr:hypothetical protein [Pararhizobium antarcticum]OJF89757.1 hypothetical protein AX760_24680 [Pararhizobium antarcticum]OJF90809.1 hypothetical protein AX761_22920 [Rhizobium sp. 58]